MEDLGHSEQPDEVEEMLTRMRMAAENHRKDWLHRKLDKYMGPSHSEQPASGSSGTWVDSEKTNAQTEVLPRPKKRQKNENKEPKKGVGTKGLTLGPAGLPPAATLR
ncbi:hypothetical protein NDU88_007356 [Pleurodeles waltl]|uniref:Uncharacterized protein n=1 Tax=Pleurodeles waltl TaxID=8319 RepID=A0AAV7UP47_PLEWA|nr:hypothetical protein NDU88_007356 [Pleurodeles waltl]